jgi:hypothetical protein
MIAGIDNGVTGTITIIDDAEKIILEVRTPTVQAFTPGGNMARRIDYQAVSTLLLSVEKVAIEYPAMGAKNNRVLFSAQRAHEALTIASELANLFPVEVHARTWQKYCWTTTEGDAKQKTKIAAGSARFPDSYCIARWLARSKR